MKMRTGRRAAGLAVLGGAAVAAGAAVEACAYRLQRRSVTLLREEPAGDDLRPLRVLHLTDIHLLACQARKIDFIRSLAQEDPDFIALTGDSLSSAHALEALLYALEPFAGLPGAFVFGSNDYFSPRPKLNPFLYLVKSRYQGTGEASSHAPDRARDLPYAEMAAAFADRGWADLNNRRARMRAAEWDLDLVGVDDPHLFYDAFPPGDDAEDEPRLRIGLAHAPYQRTLNAMKNDGRDLVLTGHTHGGQLALPVIGSLTTNCDLPNRLDSGLFAWPDTGDEPLRGEGGVVALPGEMYVDLPTGLGTSPWVPVRALRPPEAVLLEVRVVAR